jgi:hypothetical protein
LFVAYTAFLAISGLAMIAIAIIKGGQTNGARVLNGVLGVAFFGYAFYLAFLFRGGHYLLFFYAFILPILLIVRFFRTLGDRQQAPQPGTQPYASQPYGQPYPGQPPQGPYPSQPYPGQPQQGPYPSQPYPGQPPHSPY